MNRIFTFSGRDDFYRKCLYMSVSHAVMTGRYPMLDYEISWDGRNYLFNNSQGVCGVIAFTDDAFVCAVQNEDNFITGQENVINTFFDIENEKIIRIVNDEVLPYLLTEDDSGENVPSVSAAFYGDKSGIFSRQSEKETVANSGRSLLPYLFNHSDAVKYVKDYYEADDSEVAFIEELYTQRLRCDSFRMNNAQRAKLEKFAGANKDVVIQLLRETGIEY